LWEIVKEAKEITVDRRGRLFSMIASIVKVIEDKSCYYSSCKGCAKKVTDEYCEKCGESKGISTKYMFDVKISGGTEMIWVRVFEEQGDELLGLKAEDIKELHQINSEEYMRVLNKPIGEVV
jgi:DnaJ-class molecular chaperone